VAGEEGLLFSGTVVVTGVAVIVESSLLISALIEEAVADGNVGAILLYTLEDEASLDGLGGGAW
jgi:hypothetical protein